MMVPLKRGVEIQQAPHTAVDTEVNRDYSPHLPLHISGEVEVPAADEGYAETS
jgi:hypothetical protein